MPFYEYECPHCRAHTEVMQKISDKPLAKCPECGKKGLRKLVSAPVFRLKGSGWYETDFKSEKEAKRNLAGGDDAPAAKEEADKPKATAKDDAKPKPEAKAEAKPASKEIASSSASKSRASKSRAKPATRKPPARKPKAAARKRGGR